MATIDTVTTGGNDGLKVGQTFLITTTGLGNLTSINIKTAATPTAQINATNVIAPAGDGSAKLPFWANGFYPFLGAATITATDGVDIATMTKPIVIDDAYLTITIAGVLSSGNRYIAYWLGLIGRPLLNGEAIYWLFGNGLNVDVTSLTDSLMPLTTTMYVHRANGLIEAYKVSMNTGGVITSFQSVFESDKITTKPSSLRGITRQKITLPRT